MPTWLAFDAGSPVTSAAVARDGAVLAASAGESRSGPSLLQHLDNVRRDADVSLDRFDGIVVLSGPGSFTGIRVGLATALGLRAALPTPVVALSNLAALALQVAPAEETTILSLIDALRDEWFVQEFRRQGAGELRAAGPPFRTAAPEPPQLGGWQLAVHQDQKVPPAFAGHALSQARELAPAVAAAASAGALRHLFDETLDPLYLRAFTPRTPPS